MTTPFSPDLYLVRWQSPNVRGPSLETLGIEGKAITKPTEPPRSRKDRPRYIRPSHGMRR